MLYYNTAMKLGFITALVDKCLLKKLYVSVSKTLYTLTNIIS